MERQPARVTPPSIRALKGASDRIACLTAYDYPFARILDEAGVDILLVGDSLGMVVQGLENTLPVTLEEMLYHTRLVARAARRALVVADMPFLSYQCGADAAVANAGRFLKEAGAAAVKLEGGERIRPVLEALSRADIPAMGHVGITPQSIHRMGGYKVQRDRERLLADAKAVEAAGAFSIVLEGIPFDLAREITSALSIPTIGIGAGSHCDGQVLVLHDVLGLSRVPPSFSKRYADLSQIVAEAARAYCQDVRAGRFPEARQAGERRASR